MFYVIPNQDEMLLFALVRLLLDKHKTIAILLLA